MLHILTSSYLAIIPIELFGKDIQSSQHKSLFKFTIQTNFEIPINHHFQKLFSKFFMLPNEKFISV